MTKKTQRARAAAEKKPRLGDERIRPDGSVIRYVREAGDDQRPAEHYRTVDSLALMLRSGSITGAMHDAGQQFSQDFARAWADDGREERRCRAGGARGAGGCGRPRQPGWVGAVVCGRAADVYPGLCPA